MHNKVTPIHGRTPAGQSVPRRPRVIAVTSGKGGVGKTNVTTNLAIGLAKQGSRVCIFDADTGLANINILLGLTPRYTLEHLLDGSRRIDELLIHGPKGVKIIPGASGIAQFADLSRHEQQILFNSLQQIESQFDYLLIDTAAGIADTVLEFVMAAEEAILVLSPDPTSLTDAFALTRLLLRRHYPGTLSAIVNMAEGENSAKKIYNRFTQAVRKYLHIDINYLGHVNSDRAVVSAVRLQHPVMLMSPECSASRCLQDLANKVHRNVNKPGKQGFARYWQGQQEGAPPAADKSPLELISRATPPQPEPQPQAPPQLTGLPELHRRFVDCIQDGTKGAEEILEAIGPIIDAYVNRFHSFPIDMREAMSRSLELADFPEKEIRDQLAVLEHLYEARFQRPLMDKEDSLFRLLNQVRNSEAEFSAAIQRLQESYERQYEPGSHDAIEQFLGRLGSINVDKETFEGIMQRMRDFYESRFGEEYSVSAELLHRELEELASDAAAREHDMQQHLVNLTRVIAESQEALARINQLRQRLENHQS